MTPLTDRDILALTLYGEARGEPIEGQIAVASVIRNRLHAGRWGMSYESVCLAPKQFSCWNAAPDANHQKVMSLAQRVQRGEGVPELQSAYWLADGCLSGAMPDRVHGALFYHAVQMHPRPSWAQGQIPIDVIANHCFYSHVTA